MPGLNISHLKLSGFKSIQSTELELKDISVLVGENATGKSNLLSFFSMLSFIRMGQGQLQAFVEYQSGGAEFLLFRGSKHTEQISWELGINTDTHENQYSASLNWATGDRLLFSSEHLDSQRRGAIATQSLDLKSTEERESRMHESDYQSEPGIIALRGLLRECRTFQFHDTSPKSVLRKSGRESTYALSHDGGNLAAYLFRMKKEQQQEYKRVTDVCQEAVPGFRSFILEPFGDDDQFVRLQFEDSGGYICQAHQTSDGSLRFFALATLLAQPVGWSSGFVCIDEPELGLHPRALCVLSELLKTRSRDVQILIATQSRDLVKDLDIDPIIAARSEKDSTATVFKQMPPMDIDQWWDSYTLGSEWEQRG